MITNLSPVGYSFDEVRKIWSRPAFVGIPYTDGDEVEQRIARIVSESEDVSVLSDELRRKITDWPSLYHLSRSRANLLRPFEAQLGAGVDVLEVGAGCGAITRFLGECGANVLALEGSLRRAEIARSRTRDLQNVTILADQFEQFEITKKFDVVTLIGVLEYAGVFAGGADPTLAVLRRAKSLLKPQGSLILAIENQLGLKYFAGAPEDHLGVPMYGVEGQYRKADPKTFGRKELIDLLSAAGFVKNVCLAPFPDYKLPRTILTEEALTENKFDSNALVAASILSDTQLPRPLAFAPELATGTLIRNHVMLDLANSFLIVTGDLHRSLSQGRYLAWHYSTNRRKRFCKETVFCLSPGSSINVNARTLCSNQTRKEETGALLEFRTQESSSYFAGKVLATEFHNLLSKTGWSFEDLHILIRKYLSIIQSEVERQGLQIDTNRINAAVPGLYIDLIPQNILILGESKWAIIDQEWKYKKPIELGFLVYRSLLEVLASMTAVRSSGSIIAQKISDFFRNAFAAVGWDLAVEKLIEYAQTEDQLQEYVSGSLPRERAAIQAWLESELHQKNLFEELKKLRDTISSEQRAVVERTEWAKRLEQEVASAHVAVEQAQADAQEKVKWAKSLEAELGNSREAFAQEQRTVAERTEWAKKLEEELAAAAETNARETLKAEILGQEVSALSQSLVAEKQLVSERTAWAQSLEKDVESARDAHSRAARQAEDLRAELQAVLDSSCWKITAPLRWVVLPARNLMERIRRTPQTLKLLIIDRKRGFFDAAWYLQRYPDVRDAGKRPFVHYALHGFFEGRMPRDFCPAGPVNNSPSPEPPVDQWRGFTQLVRARLTSPQRMFKAARTTFNLLRSGGLDSFKQGVDIALMLQPPLPDSFDPNLERFLRVGFGEDTTQRVMSLLHSIQLGHRDAASHEALLRELRERLKKAAEAAAKISSKTPAASIVVPVYNQVIYTAACAISLFESLPSNTFELIIADDCSTDETFKFFKGVSSSIRVVKTSGNYGFLRNCNNAASTATGEFLVFLNNDTIVLPGWLDELIGTFSSMPNCGIVGSKLINLDGTLQEAGGIFWSDGSAWNYGRNSDPAKPEFNYVRPTDYCSGASLCVRASVWREHCGFDEYYDRAYCEDSDLSFRLRRDSRLETYYQPFSVLIHHEGISSGKDLNKGEKSYQLVNQARFYERWRSVLEKEHRSNVSDVFLARGRSSGKKTIVVSDNNIPQPDRDAGSRTLFQVMEVLVRKGINVVFWSYNQWHDPQYTSWLQRLGVLVTYSSTDSPSFDDWLSQHSQHIDAFLLARPHVVWDMLPIVRKHSKKTVFFYGHDIHHLRLEIEQKVHGNSPVVDSEKSHFEKIEKDLWSLVDVCLYPTSEEAIYVQSYLRGAKKEGKAIYFPAFAFHSFAEGAHLNVDRRRGLLFVGGFVHRPNIDGLLWFAENVWPDLRRTYPDLIFTVVGAKPPPQIRDLEKVGIKLAGYVNDAELARLYSEARVVVAPLLAGAGIKGKVAEALRWGVPVVTTPIGAQGFIDKERAIAQAEDPSLMARLIGGLLEDDDLWKSRSISSVALAKQMFSQDAMWEVLSKIVTGTTQSLHDTSKCTQLIDR